MENYSVILPAAGLGTRLKSRKPKLLSRFIDDEYLYEKQPTSIRKILGGISLYYVCGFEYQKISKKLRNESEIVYNDSFNNTNVAYSVSLALNQIKTENALIVYGDLFFNRNLLSQIKNSGETSFILTDRKLMEKDEVGCWGNGNISQFGHSLDMTWGQIVYLKGKDITKFQDLSKINAKFLGFEVLNRMIDDGSRFDIIESDKNSVVFDIDSTKDINRANALIEKGI